jgi:hypothetical protein
MKNISLERKLKSLTQRVATLELIADFLKLHPEIASQCVLKPVSNGIVSLYFEDLALIRPAGLGSTALRLERYVEDLGDDSQRENRILCEDLSKLSSSKLRAVLKKLDIELD